MANKRSINKVILVGTVGREPEITHLPNVGRDLAKFSMVTTEVYMDKKTNQFQEMPEWHNIVAWGYSVKKVERDVHKGSLVLVEGKIKTRKWQDKNGQDRWTTEIMADSVTSLDRPQARDGQGYPPGGGMEAPRASYGSGQGSGSQSQSHRGSGAPAMDGYPYDGPQAPPEMQIDDMQYEEDSDPF